MTRLDLPPSPKILVVVLQRLGDVLLATPLIRSLKRAWPESQIDALVFADTAGILAGNPDLNSVVTMPQRPSAAQSLRLATRLWRRYALAISTQAGDRPTFFACAAGRIRVAPVEMRLTGHIKSFALNRTMPVAPRLHRVLQTLQLAELLGIAPVPQVVCPAAVVPPDSPQYAYALIHAAPMFRYKQWTRDGWRKLAQAIAKRGLQVIATGGPGARERAYLDDIWDGVDVLRLDGRLSWGELTGLISRASLYVGPDTSVTHLAAASGRPTVALYGPTDPSLWGPWPADGLSSQWSRTGTIQRRDNVWLVQQQLPCVPCQLEGCERRIDSYSRCLDDMSFEAVMTATEQALASN